MKFTHFAAVAAFAGIANAQATCAPLAQSIPACALGYIASYAYSSLSCGLVDFQCQCSGLESIANGAGPAIASVSGCGLAQVLGPAQSLCSCATANAGQTISLNAVESKCQPTAAAIPPCALGYLAEGAYQIAQCSLNDFECQCSHFTDIENAIINTVSTACGSTALDVVNSASALCACVSGAGGGSGGSSAAATTAGSGAGATGSASTTPKATAGSGGSGSTGGMATFTGAGATAGAAFGGVVGIVGALAAFL